ncbi:DUF2171 domain-containing protein [Stakelama tenebrarum]|uniref:DUF2171 domain-containing protein n=1 Tax=Stakelama tenebrarum TaxID=2711215 RepID=A0A6G6Y3B0_9SPHN|nr:DUF2171 domain-containing protein [Sphingosinithalassobacter tenebrarum]QIG79434.1 DUF2171 domain-containing protein [Sphingosinithalassobacter tenebrarum]
MDDRYYPQGREPGYGPRRSADDFTRDYGSGRAYTHSSARDYEAAGYDDRLPRRVARDPDAYEHRRPDDGRFYGMGSEYGHHGDDYDRRPRPRISRAGRPRYRGERYGERGLSRPDDYDYEDRGFMARAGDELRRWFGDEEAERRRHMDERADERWADPYNEDGHYRRWRRERMAELDRDYEEYRRENADRFHREFSAFRDDRKGQRDSLDRVEEHMEVTGSDGSHVGKVDKVRGDRILLTKSDKDAGGHHHSIPSRWIDTVDAKNAKVQLRKTAEEAQDHWRDEERNMAMFRDSDEAESAKALNRSFSSTY